MFVRICCLSTFLVVCWAVPSMLHAQSSVTTVHGQPDIQGVWVNFDRTPLEVPLESDSQRLDALERWFPGLELTAEGIRGITGPNPGGLSDFLGEGDG